MSIKHPCCFCYTVVPAFVQLVHVYVLAYAGASKWAQWTATAKSCKDKLLCNAFWQIRLSWVVLLLIYRADASRSWAVGRQKFREIRSCCWLRGSLLWYFNWIRWAATEKEDASGTLPFTWKGLSPHRPRTTGKTCVRTCRGRSAWWLFVYCTSPCAGKDWFVSICHHRFCLEPWRNTPRCSAELWPRSTRKSVSSSLSLTSF